MFLSARLGRFLTGFGGALLCAVSMSVQAADISVWHALNPHNKSVLEDLVKRFNRQSKDTKVRLTGFASTDALEAALTMTSRESDRPHLMQLDESRLPDMAAQRSYIQPLHSLFARYGAKNVDWFLPVQNTVARDSKGQLQAFPFMLDIPVMYYNHKAFERAGLAGGTPERSWARLQSQLVHLGNNGSRRCPITTDQPVSINLENLAAVNNQPYTLAQGKQGAKGAPVFHFDSLYIRHLSLMISWVRSELLLSPEFNDSAAERFAQGECAVLLSQSSNMGWFGKRSSVDFGVTGLPYYPEVTQNPGLAFVGGSALWATSGHGKDEEAATVEFLSWLAQPEQATQWYERTGFLPLTKQAFAQARTSATPMAQWHAMVAQYENKPVATSSGFQISNYPQIRAMLHESLGRALGGQETAVNILKAASDEAGRIALGQ